MKIIINVPIIFSGITEWYARGVDTAKTATRYRKGACENCGAITHKKRVIVDFVYTKKHKNKIR